MAEPESRARILARQAKRAREVRRLATVGDQGPADGVHCWLRYRIAGWAGA